MSLPSGGPRSPWCIVDLVSGEILRGAGMPGDLRAILFDSAHQAADPRPWVLATFGLGRLHLGPRPAVTDVVRKGIGKYRTTLLDLGPDVFGVGHYQGASLLVVRKSDGSPVKRIRVPGPRVAYSLSDGRVRVLGFHHAEACDVDITTLRVVDRHVLPYGTGARHVGGEVIALLGRRKDIRAVSDISELEPDEPIVLLVGQPDGEAEQPMGTLGWNVLPREIAVLDPDTLTIRRRAPAPPGVVEVLGVARDGNIVVATRRGFVLLNPHTLSLITGYEQAQPISGAVLCAAHNLVALHVEDPPNDGLHAVQWRHKPTR